MQEYVHRLPDALTGVTDELDAEFERLLVESSTLAFRVAYGVLRQREDAEDVAQEAFIKAHRNFGRLRDRARFRAWLVGQTVVEPGQYKMDIAVKDSTLSSSNQIQGAPAIARGTHLPHVRLERHRAAERRPDVTTHNRRRSHHR
jgi:hypothetical protein